MECPINLEQCETYCNERQVMPAMRHFIEEEGMSVNAAAAAVSKLTDGQVTQGRARQVWNNRKALHKRATVTDIGDWAIEQIHKDMIEDGTLTQEKATAALSNYKYLALWLTLWVQMEESVILEWYQEAFDEIGQRAKLTDMFRTGKMWCDCPKCKGKTWKKAPWGAQIPEVFTEDGFIDYRLLSTIIEYRKRVNNV